MISSNAEAQRDDALRGAMGVVVGLQKQAAGLSEENCEPLLQHKRIKYGQLQTMKWRGILFTTTLPKANF